MTQNPQRFVLLADDEEIVQEMCSRAFVHHPEYLLDIAASVRDALDKVAVFAYDAVILDMAFPTGGSGLEILRSIREHEMDAYTWRQKLKSESHILDAPELPHLTPAMRTSAFILTGSSSPSAMILDAQALGVVNLFLKPARLTKEFVLGMIKQMGQKME